MSSSNGFHFSFVVRWTKQTVIWAVKPDEMNLVTVCEVHSAIADVSNYFRSKKQANKTIYGNKTGSSQDQSMGERGLTHHRVITSHSIIFISLRRQVSPTETTLTLWCKYLIVIHNLTVLVYMFFESNLISC